MSFSLYTIAPYLGAVGNELVNLDENLEGADDYAGQLLIYTAEVAAAIHDRQEIPEVPEEITKGVKGRVSPALKATLRIASAALSFAQFNLSGKSATVIKYINQLLRALIANLDIPATPKSVLDELRLPLNRDAQMSRLESLESQVESLSGKADKREKFEQRLAEVESHTRKIAEIEGSIQNLQNSLSTISTPSPS